MVCNLLQLCDVYISIKDYNYRKEGEWMGYIEPNKEFIEKICIDHWKELYRFISYKVHNREAAEDLTQETFIKAISYLKDHDIEILEYNSYLKAIAMNLIRDEWRKTSKKKIPLKLEDIHPEELSVDDFSQSVGEHAEIEAAISRLSKDQQMVINLRIVKGYSVVETAKILNKKKGTIRVLQFRAVKELARIFEEISK